MDLESRIIEAIKELQPYASQKAIAEKVGIDESRIGPVLRLLKERGKIRCVTAAKANFWQVVTDSGGRASGKK